MNIRTANSPITIYIQHPIPIPAPGDKNKAVLKPLKLTKKVCSNHKLPRSVITKLRLQEQKKMRKQRRQAELQDKRDRIRMGLIPPDPPKGIIKWLFYSLHANDVSQQFVLRTS